MAAPNRAGRSLAAAGAVIALGAAAGWYVQLFLIRVITQLRWWVSTGVWLDNSGHHRAMYCWVSVILQLPSWIPALVLGVGIGWLAPRKWLWLGLLCGMSLVVTPQLLMYLHGMGTFQLYNLGMAIDMTAWDATAIPLLLASAWCAKHWQKTRPSGRSAFPIADPAAARRAS